MHTGAGRALRRRDAQAFGLLPQDLLVPSGKSTSVEAIRHFFSRHGFRVHVLIERASVCPIPMKGHLFFNTWCASTMLAELLANVETETDIIIVDRGLLDALVWLTLQHKRGELTQDEQRIIEEFLLPDRWRSLIDLAVVLNVSPQEALNRENSQRISTKSGSIMNLAVLSAIAESVDETVVRYNSKFNSVIRHEISGSGIRASNVGLAEQILDQLTAFLDPEILVVPREDVVTLPLTDGGCFSEEGKEALAELLLRRQGTHVAKRDSLSGVPLLQSSLIDRITRSLFLSRRFPITLEGYCWDRDDSDSNRHFGVIFRVEIDNDDAADNLRKKEFRSKRGHGLAGNFIRWEQLQSEEVKPALETWSLAILNNWRNGEPTGGS
jgi:hypothetical protein